MKNSDTFRLLTEEQAGALLGLLVGSLFLWDVTQRALERFFG
jgi:hypothetical protein